jgi:hypothetical protein
MSLSENQQKNSPFVEFSLEMIMKLRKCLLNIFYLKRNLLYDKYFASEKYKTDVCAIKKQFNKL